MLEQSHETRQRKETKISFHRENSFFCIKKFEHLQLNLENFVLSALETNGTLHKFYVAIQYLFQATLKNLEDERFKKLLKIMNLGNCEILNINIQSVATIN